jgi:hypothetical protein
MTDVHVHEYGEDNVDGTTNRSSLMNGHWRISRTGIVVVAAVAIVSGAARPEALTNGAVAGAGAVRGTVRYAGSPPAAEPVDMSGEAACAAAHAGRTVALQKVQVGADGGLQDAIVYVRDAPRGPAASAEPALLDQRGCIYEPHVIALRVGQPLVIRNSDPTLHNVHVRAERNREFNIGQPIQGLESRRAFDAAEVGIDVSCDVHGWMSGVIAVFDHAHFDVTGEDGSFVLPNLPAGDYVVEVWHETLGVRTQPVTVPATGAAQVTIEFGS